MVFLIPVVLISHIDAWKSFANFELHNRESSFVCREAKFLAATDIHNMLIASELSIRANCDLVNGAVL